MKYIHVRNLERFHPGYKDRDLSWAKIYFTMAQGDPDCEMIKDEIDWARLIKFIILELGAKKPLPLDDDYLARKGFDLKKRSISLTLDVLQGFLEIVTDDSKPCNVEKRREEKSKRREEGEGEQKVFLNLWNEFCKNNQGIPAIKEITRSRSEKLKNRLANPLFNIQEIFNAIKEQPFLTGQNDRKWAVSFDWIVENDTNFIKVLERKYIQSAPVTGDGVSPAVAALLRKVKGNPNA